EALPNPEMKDVAELEAKFKTVGAANQDPATVNRMSLIDSVMEDYNRVINDRRISSVDKNRLSNAVELWNEARNRRSQTGGNACNLIFPNAPSASQSPRAPWQAYDEYLMDMLSVALACGLTKVVTYVMAHAGSDLYSNFGEYDRLHAVQHDP